MKPDLVERRESIPAFRRISTYLPMMIILGLGVPVLMYLMLMQTLGWSAPLIMTNGKVSVAASSNENIILYASPSTKAYFGIIGGNYDTLLVPWRNYFANRKQSYKEVREPGQLKEFKNGVLVLPSAIALSDEERAEILSFRQKGGSILATWATGSRNGKGDWAGWEFLETVGVKMVGEIPPAAEVNYLVLNGESPVTYKHPAGQRLPLNKTSETLLRVKGEMVAGRFMNWARIVDEERRDEGAIIYTETAQNSSRTTFYAFAESVWESRPLMMYDVIDSSFQWLQRKPVIVRAAWPHGKRAAQVIEMDTEDGFPNAEVFASMMRAIDYRATFYVLTSVGRRFPEVLSRLHRDFEVGYHADVHDSFKGQPPKLQEQRMQIMRTEMATVIPEVSTITGFRAPLEGYDAATEPLLHKYGIRHHAADPSRTEARLPIVSKLSDVAADDALIVLPRTQRDDINLASQNFNVEQTAQELIKDLDLAIDQGALGLLSVHSQNFHADGVLAKAMQVYIERLKQHKGDLWLASAGQVADWWREREQFRVSTITPGKRLELDITVVGKKRLNGASVIVMLPQKGRSPNVQPVKTGLEKPAVIKIDEYRAAIIFGALVPGNYAYQVTF